MRISCKQINQFGPRILKPDRLGGCPRQWAAWYLENNRPDFVPPNLAFGIRFHAVCAALVETGRMPEPSKLQPGVALTEFDVLPEGQLGKMARAALVHLPENQVAGEAYRTWQVEQEWLFDWTTSNGLQVEIDLRPDVCSDESLIHLIDWKSTSHRRYTLDSLVDDVQANVYAVGLMRRFSRVNTLARWVYVEKTGQFKSWPIDCMFQLKNSEQWLHDNIDATIELIHTLREMNPKALDLPGDDGACQGTGRFCDYAGTCLNSNGPKPARLIQLDEINRYRNGH